MSGPEPRSARGACLRIVLVDALISAMVLVGWAENGFGPEGLIWAMGGLRLVVSSAYLWHLLAPLQRWQDASDPSDDVLLAADDAMQKLWQRLSVVQVSAWVVALTVPLSLRVLNPETPLVLGEQVFASALMAVALIFNSAVMFACLRQQSDALTPELGLELARRRLAPRRSEQSHGRELIFIGVALTGSLMLSTGLSGFSVESKRARENVEAELREQLLRGEEREDRPFVRLATEQLDARLQALLDGGAAEPGTLISAYDPRRDEVLAALAQSGEEWLYIAHPASENLEGWLPGFFIYLSLTIALVGLTMYWLTRALVGPLARLEGVSRRLAEHGDLDPRGRAAPARNDEIGALVDNFNAMLDMLAELVGAAQAVSKGDLSVELERPGDLHDAFRTMVAQLHEMVEQIRETAIEVTSATVEIHASTEHQAKLAERHASELEGTNATIQALAGAARSIDQLSAEVRDHAQTNLETIDQMVARIDELGEEAAGIGGLLEQIAEVAARSDLLALNGSLEATRAGEAGRGFALVATEMRRLAERTSAVVADVHARMQGIERSRADTIMATAQSRRTATLTAEAAERISNLSRTQTTDSERAADTAAQMAELVGSTASGMVQTRAAADGLRIHVAELERLTRSFKLRALGKPPNEMS